VPGSLLTQVGRGYTDLCAALCAVGLNASELQIWKEVDGIFTADPRKVPKARLLPHITPEEAAELTYYGSEVIHPFTMEQVINASIPIRIKNVERPSGAGTVIFPDVSSSHPGTPPVHVSASAMQAIALDPTMNAKIPTAVTIKDSILVLNVRSNRKTISHAFLGKIFGTLDRFGIVVDLISTSEVHVSIAMNGSMRRQLLDKVVAELRKVGDVSHLRSHLISCYGAIF
jgi:aspartate kinase